MPNLVDLPDYFQFSRFQHDDWEDFKYYVSAHKWTSVVGGAATIAVADGASGILTMSSIDSTLDRELYLKMTAQCYKIAAGKPIFFETFIQYTEGATNKANVIVGLMDSVGNASLVNGSAGPKTSFSGACIYKVGNSTVWKTISSVSTAQTLTTTNSTAGGASYQRLRIEIKPISSTVAEVAYFLDTGSGLSIAKDSNNRVYKDQLTYTGAVNMTPFIGLKNGAASAEILNVDYIYCLQDR